MKRNLFVSAVLMLFISDLGIAYATPPRFELRLSNKRETVFDFYQTRLPLKAHYQNAQAACEPLQVFFNSDDALSTMRVRVIVKGNYKVTSQNAIDLGEAWSWVDIEPKSKCEHPDVTITVAKVRD